MYSNIFSSEIRQQNRTEQNRTEQNRTEPLQGFLRSQNRTITRLFSVVLIKPLFTLLLVIRNKILSLIILKFFMQFSKFLNAHPSGHKARGYAFLSLSNTGFDFRTTPLLFNFKIKKIFFALLSFFILFTISCGNENKTKNEIYERNISYYAGDWINSDTKEKIFIINSNGSIIVNGENINDTKCCKIKIDYYTDTYQQTLHSKDLYIPRDKINTDGKFYPMLDDGQEFKSFICSFGGNTVLKVKVYNSAYLLADNGEKVKEVEKSLEIESKKGAFKTITSRIKETYKKACNELIEEIDNQIKISYEDLEKQKNKIDSIFVNENYRNIILKSYEDYIVDFKTKRAEVEQEKIKIEKCQTD
ncbi:hypothetical protein [uncultured Brachyspira sp.]|uniref:hypothetical protein n=1 Tax=uncultured Brachyspira sp. TaxID=221953 RepID=UPI00259A3160|nr:hypothetical protein [uncultured Brachyspira sp.]